MNTQEFKKSQKLILLQSLLDKAKSLPTESGCYLMMNSDREVLYVGKAKNLRQRVSSYFLDSAKDSKTIALVHHIADFDFMITSNEVESFVLENNLIKRHLPKYNIRLKDDKSYPYAQINFAEPFPRVEYTRRPKIKKLVKVFGPYPDATSFRNVLVMLTKYWRLRDCSLSEFKKRKTPCLLYQMQQCSAPCVGYINEENYLASLKMMMNFLIDPTKHKKNREHGLLQKFATEMLSASEQEEFEQAAWLRDGYQILDRFLAAYEKQHVEDLSATGVSKDQGGGRSGDLDLLGTYVSDHEIDMTLYTIRGGVLMGHQHYFWNRTELDKENDIDYVAVEILPQLILHYQKQPSLPKSVMVDWDAEKRNFAELIVHQLFTQDQLGCDLKFIPNKGKYKELHKKAIMHAYEEQEIRRKSHHRVDLALEQLQKILGLTEIPFVIECFDIAIWQGKTPTGAQVVFTGGRPDKKSYRYYHLTELPEGNNDFAMLEELLRRRLKAGNFPDLWVIDGGKAQLGVAQKVWHEVMGLEKKGDKDYNGEEGMLPIVALAKERQREGTRERLFVLGNKEALELDEYPAVKYLLMQLRDEAHRFCRKLHHKGEKKRIIPE